MLYIIATPIGNLGDFSKRACETISQCDYLLCEDTRHSVHLLNHYGLKRPLKSYHKFNERKIEESVIHDLKNKMTIGLLSDAGMPTIADPGERIVQRCIAEGIEVTVIPGPSSVLTALVLSGFALLRFQFLGFIPKTAPKRKAALLEAIDYQGVTIFFESPHRILKTLELLSQLNPEIRVALARELTKKFEEVSRGSAKEVFEAWKSRSPKGEFVLIISSSE